MPRTWRFIWLLMPRPCLLRPKQLREDGFPEMPSRITMPLLKTPFCNGREQQKMLRSSSINQALPMIPLIGLSRYRINVGFTCTCTDTKHGRSGEEPDTLLNEHIPKA